MTLARYELADPPTRDMDELVSLKDPEVYAWFCLTMLMLKETGYVTPSPTLNDSS